MTSSACSHIAAISQEPAPSTEEGCEDCIANGSRGWVHLRLCLACGHVGCCDSSPGKHASKHAAADGHPVIRSFEPGETWRWCFIDHVGG
ncbi:UBP-type zinc finger domain-containing protein [Lentzea tibetensis]|uniref:UBP-type zinc finger domain-containing protein n=1 Tax=Lentzea tibetensis TaxID=2591470 RepID=UPI001F2527D1|nr:UBP-type zinc finger domain-containing protein [Lentzea tibetensis]